MAKEFSENLPRDKEYWVKLIKLNNAFLSWVKRYMEISSDYDFSPVCADYINHVVKLQQTYPVLEDYRIIGDGKTSLVSSSSETEPVDTNLVPSDKPLPNQLPNKTPSPPSSMSTEPIQPIGLSTIEPLNPSSSQPTFRFDPVSFTASSSNTLTNSFKFDSSIFKSEPIPPSTNSFKFEPLPKTNSLFNSDPIEGNNDDDDQDEECPEPEPPKVFEQDALYSVRCKLMLVDKEKLKDRGLGQLYIKKADGKSQLVIRTDNANGTILLNIRLTKLLPITYRGNGVMLGCTPNPPLESDPNNQKPVTFFIKVKNKDVGKELEKKLLEYRD